MSVEVLAICGNNVLSPVLFFGSNEETDMDNFCNLVGCLKFRTEFECRAKNMLKVLSIVDVTSLTDLLEKYVYSWSFIVPRTSNEDFRKALLGGTFDYTKTEKALWYSHLYRLLYIDEIQSINFVSVRDFNDLEHDICLLSHSEHEMEWRRILEDNIEFIQENGIDEFRVKVDLENGYYTKGAE